MSTLAGTSELRELSFHGMDQEGRPCRLVSLPRAERGTSWVLGQSAREIDPNLFKDLGTLAGYGLS